MSIYKRCSRDERWPDGSPNALYCATSPKCEHDWHYYFRVAGQRYRASTETSDKHQAQNIEARERSRALDGRHGIRQRPDITFTRFAEIYMTDHSELHKRSAERDREVVAQEGDALLVVDPAVRSRRIGEIGAVFGHIDRRIAVMVAQLAQ